MFIFVFIFRTACAIHCSDLNRANSVCAGGWKQSELRLSGRTSKDFSPFSSDVGRLLCVCIRCSLEFPDERRPRLHRVSSCTGRWDGSWLGYSLQDKARPGRCQREPLVQQQKQTLVGQKCCIYTNRQIKRVCAFNANWPQVWQKYLSCVENVTAYLGQEVFVSPAVCLASVHLERGVILNCFHMWLDVKETQRLSRSFLWHYSALRSFADVTKCLLAGCWTAMLKTFCCSETCWRFISSKAELVIANPTTAVRPRRGTSKKKKHDYRKKFYFRTILRCWKMKTSQSFSRLCAFFTYL